jgi:UDP-N-acetyl-2-amino-2-deoxyglucuronate dehydrogenase
MTNLGIGIVGAGRIFGQHASACLELADRAQLIAVADPDEPRRQKATTQHFIPFAYSDYQRLLENNQVDVVIVCTPPVMHERIVVDALEAGKFVVSEKPLAHTLHSADKILATAEKHPGKLSTVHQFRYLPEVQRTCWLRDHGHLGRLMFGRFSRFARWEKPAKGKDGAKPAKKRTAWWGEWATAGGGMAMTQLIHELDLMLHIFGRATEVTATMETLREPIESEDTCAATVRFASGALACCYGTMAAQRPAHGFDVIGERASAHFPWSLESMDQNGREESLREVLEIYPDPSEPQEFNPHTPYLSAVFDAILQGLPLPVAPEEARAAVEICTAIYASALSRQSIVLPLNQKGSCYGGLTAADYNGGSRLKPMPNDQQTAGQMPAGASS